MASDSFGKDTGLSPEKLSRKHSISTQTFYRRKSNYGGMDLKETQRLRDLENENDELKKALGRPHDAGQGAQDCLGLFELPKRCQSFR